MTPLLSVAGVHIRMLLLPGPISLQEPAENYQHRDNGLQFNWRDRRPVRYAGDDVICSQYFLVFGHGALNCSW